MRETRNLEFKENASSSFLKTVSAFANYAGGTVLFGVRDDGCVIGIDRPAEQCLAIENRINDSITPLPEYELVIREMDSVVELRVSPGRSKPYLYKSKAYRRSDSSTVEVDQIELTRLILQGRNLTFDQLPSGRQSLSFSYLEKRLRARIGIEAFGRDTLKTLNLFSDSSGYNNAAALLADENDFPGIDIAQFGGSISVVLRRETFQHASVLEELDSAMSVFEDIYVFEEISGFERKAVERIPREAFREAIANTVVHRTWDVSAHIRISMFEDRIEVTSPGGLPAGITEEEYLNDMLSVRRNPVLANVLYRLGMIEAFGTGIIRIKELYEQSASKPDFAVTENTVTVVLPVTQSDIDLTSDERAVYNVLSRVRPMASREIIGELDFSRSKLNRVLKSMVDAGYITTVGSGRGLKYKRP